MREEHIRFCTSDEFDKAIHRFTRQIPRQVPDLIARGHNAPESLRSPTMQGSLSADIFSCGCVLFAMLSGRLPFWPKENPTAPEIFKAVVECQYTMSSKITDTDIQDLIRKIFVSDPKERITLEQILQNPWLSTLQQNVPLPRSPAFFPAAAGAAPAAAVGDDTQQSANEEQRIRSAAAALIAQLHLVVGNIQTIKDNALRDQLETGLTTELRRAFRALAHMPELHGDAPQQPKR